MAVHDIERRLRRLEQTTGGETKLCAEYFLGWMKWQREHGDPGGELARAEAEAATRLKAFHESLGQEWQPERLRRWC